MSPRTTQAHRGRWYGVGMRLRLTVLAATVMPWVAGCAGPDDAALGLRSTVQGAVAQTPAVRPAQTRPEGPESSASDGLAVTASTLSPGDRLECWQLMGPPDGFVDLGSACRNHAVRTASKTISRMHDWFVGLLIAVAFLGGLLPRVPLVLAVLDRFDAAGEDFLLRGVWPRRFITGYVLLLLGTFIVLTRYHESHCPSIIHRWCEESLRRELGRDPGPAVP